MYFAGNVIHFAVASRVREREGDREGVKERDCVCVCVNYACRVNAWPGLCLNESTWLM